MKAIRILVCALALLTLLAQCALCTQVWTEQRISTSTAGTRGNPKVWEDKVYWTDRRSGKGEIYVWDRAGGERLYRTDAASIGISAVYGNRMAYSRSISGMSELYVWDPVNGDRLVSATSAPRFSTNMYGDTLVWQDARTGVDQIYMWDPVHGERAVSPTGYSQTNPRVWGDTVVWSDGRQGGEGIYTWDPVDGARRIDAGAYEATIYGNHVAMLRSTRDYAGVYHTYLDMWDRTLGYVTSSVYVGGGSPYGMSMWGESVAWQTDNTSPDLTSWDPIYGMATINQGMRGQAMSPYLYGRTVAWVGLSGSNSPADIYLSTMVPEPGSMVGLVLGLAGLASGALRRRRQRH